MFAVDFYDKLGYDRPIHFLTHDVMFHANRGNAATALRAGAVVMVFPGGDYEVYRPTLSENVIDFEGRTGYVRTAIDAGVPIVPAVSIGGQENQFYLSRGIWLAQALRLDNFEHRFFRTNILPIAFGFPFGLSIWCRSTCRCPPRSSPRCSSRSTSSRSSVRFPTSLRSTHTCAA